MPWIWQCDYECALRRCLEAELELSEVRYVRRTGQDLRSKSFSKLSPKRDTTLGLTAVATSIDAAAVGITLALVSVNIVAVTLAIGTTTFALATAGLLIGREFGARFGPIVELVGGLGLIAIGSGILLEHTGVTG